MKAFSIILVLSALIMAGFRYVGYEQKPWVVPDAAKNKKNPVAKNAESLSTGKALYDKHCKSCHGAKGLGDGSKSSQLKTDPGDFSKSDYVSQTDGSLFFKISEGREDMPGFKKKIPDEEEIWSIVTYTRSFKK